MLPRSAGFDAAVIQSHEVAFRCEVLDPDGLVLFTLDPVGGRVTVDRSASQRRTCEFTVRGTLAENVPSNFDPKLLLPYGTEVRLQRGIPDELLGLGIFRLTDVDEDWTLEDGIGIRFKGSDRSERLSRELIAAFDAAEGSNYGNVINSLLQQAWQGASTEFSAPPVNFEGVVHQTPTLHFEAKTNAWEEATRMATSCGKELFPDYEGVIALKDLPSIDDPSVWQFVDGPTDTRVRLARHYSSANTPNYFTVNGSGPGVTDAEISGVAFVQDPTSNLDVAGAYGTNPKWLDSTYVTSNEQARDAARAELAKVMAGTDTLTIDTVPHPALDAGDVVTVTADALDIFEELYIVNTVSIPFDLISPMQVSVGRAVTVETVVTG